MSSYMHTISDVILLLYWLNEFNSIVRSMYYKSAVGFYKVTYFYDE